MRKYALGIIASTLFLGLGIAPVQAFHCPADVKAIDNALGKADLSAEQRAEAKRLRDQGEAQHEAGSHREAVDTLSQAMRIILNNM